MCYNDLNEFSMRTTLTCTRSSSGPGLVEAQRPSADRGANSKLAASRLRHLALGLTDAWTFDTHARSPRSILPYAPHLYFTATNPMFKFHDYVHLLLVPTPIFCDAIPLRYLQPSVTPALRANHDLGKPIRDIRPERCVSRMILRLGVGCRW
jgi:hypothetical protein